MDNDTVRKFLPNYIQPGLGEENLIDKISPFIDAAETWVNCYVATQQFADGFEHLKELRDNIVAARALFLAAPALDVTMHPNGLAVVNTDALAPASAERSREFRKALDRQILENIDRFMEAVTADESIWSVYFVTCPPTVIWRASIFFSCDDLISFTGIDRSADEFIHTLHKVSEIEDSFAEKYISYPLLWEFRNNKGPQENPKSDIYFAIVSSLKRIIASMAMSNGSELYPHIKFRRIVNEIRKHPNVFPQWHNSDTAKLYDPPVFRNDRTSGGYFF